AAYCWGEAANGQLGNGDTDDQRTPDRVDGDVTFRAIAAGAAHVCGLTSRGAAYCWGQNTAGQLGNGSTGNETRPAPVEGDLRFRSVAAGSTHSCGIDMNSGALCWGEGANGRLGNGALSDIYDVPVPVASAGEFVSLALGWAHTCGLSPGGAGYCWGADFDGQLGNGTVADLFIYINPVQVSSPE
ncbi:MAG: RCC1 repeat-containing protein, partial [Chloroflexi bacterium]|nr:RCC1 repeat-containing protein [Chloroflexota bacterium]